MVQETSPQAGAKEKLGPERINASFFRDFLAMDGPPIKIGSVLNMMTTPLTNMLVKPVAKARCAAKKHGTRRAAVFVLREETTFHHARVLRRN
jgi:hypothetical protein